MYPTIFSFLLLPHVFLNSFQAVEGGPAEGDIVAALHPSYGRSLMNGSDTYWDATVRALLICGLAAEKLVGVYPFSLSLFVTNI